MKSELLGKLSTFTCKLFKFIKSVALKQSFFFFFFFLVSLPLGGFFNCRAFHGSREPNCHCNISSSSHFGRGRALDGVVWAGSIREPESQLRHEHCVPFTEPPQAQGPQFSAMGFNLGVRLI